MQSSDTVQREILKLSEALLLCQRELAQVRQAQEPLMEQCSQWCADSTNAKTISTYLAESLAGHLSRAYWEVHEPRSPITWRRFMESRWPWLRDIFQRGQSKDVQLEVERIRLIEGSQLFNAAWYLQQHADVAVAGINPAAHYFQSGASEGRDPSPEFSTRDYLEQHPECGQSGLNPLIHHLQSQSMSA